jgi:hypothetical protein
MEKISYLPNGQWILEKAKPETKGEAWHYGEAKVPFTDEHAIEQQDYAHDMAASHSKHAVKKMLNEKGEMEDHVMLHRGITGYDPEKSDEYNKLSISPTHIESSDHSVHTLYHDVAGSYSKKTGSSGKVLSFWVPKSKIKSMGQKNVEHLITNRQTLKQIYDEHADTQKHTSIHPGKFQRATPEEVQRVLESGKISPNLKDKLYNKYMPLQQEKKQAIKDKIEAGERDPKTMALKEKMMQLKFGSPEHKKIAQEWRDAMGEAKTKEIRDKAIKRRSK